MKPLDRNNFRQFLLSLSVIIFTATCILCYNACNEGIKKNVLESIRLGYPTSLATQGQITATLKKTNILKTNGLKVDFKGFSYGGPLTEAAMADQLDVIFVGDQPTINLIAKTGKWKIIGRLIYTNVGIFVSPDSKISSMAELKGRTVASPFNSVANRECMNAEKETGLNANTDFKNINIDILEIANMVQSKNWQNADAISVWDPLTTLINTKKLGKAIKTSPALVVIAVSNEFADKHPESVTKFLTAVSQAYYYFSQHVAEANTWYKETEGIKTPDNILNEAMQIEPNIKSKSINDIDLSIHEKDSIALKSAIDYAFDNKYTIVKLTVPQILNSNFYNKSKEHIHSQKFDIKDVELNKK